MKNLYHEKDGVFDVMEGSKITDTITEAIALSREEGQGLIVFEFNGVTLTVSWNSSPELVYRDWSRALNGCIEKNVGPYPASVLTEQEKANDALIKAENESRGQKLKAEYEAESKAKREAVEAKLAGAPDIELANGDAWHEFSDNNQDSYGGAVVTYSERWARLMQMEMATGKELESIARITSHNADLEGITGFQYGAAVSTLSQCWRYGEQLRRWHNLDTQLGSEGEKANTSGGVLNPALLNIGNAKGGDA